MNQEFIFDENGNCGGSPNTYVTSNRSSSDNSMEDEALMKKGKRKKALPQPQELVAMERAFYESFLEKLKKL